MPRIRKKSTINFQNVATEMSNRITATTTGSQQSHFANRCLVCYKTENSFRRTEPRSGGESSTLEEQLKVIFILRNLFEIPAERLNVFLVSLGNPEAWIWLCSKCQESVKEALEAQEELVMVYGRLMELKGKVIGMVKESSSVGSQGQSSIGESLWITDQCRNFVLTNDYGPFENPFKPGDSRAESLISSTLKEIGEVRKQRVQIPMRSMPSMPMIVSTTTTAVKQETTTDLDYQVDPLMDPDWDNSEPMEFSADYDDLSNSMPLPLAEQERISGPAIETEFPAPNEIINWKDLDLSDASSLQPEVHFKKTNNDNWKCLECGTVSTTWDLFVMHAKLHQTSPFKCWVCRKVYPVRRGLYLHGNKYHNAEFKKHMDAKKGRDRLLRDAGFSRVKAKKGQDRLLRFSRVKAKKVQDRLLGDVGFSEVKAKKGQDWLLDVGVSGVKTNKGDGDDCGDSSNLPKVSDSSEAINWSELDLNDERNLLPGVHFRITGRNNWKCLGCQNLSKTWKLFVLHAKLHQTSRFRCRMCKRVYSSRKQLQIHGIKSHPYVYCKKVIKKLKLRADVRAGQNGECDWSESSDYDEAKIKPGKYYEMTEGNRFRCLKCGDSKIKSYRAFVEHVILHKTSQFKCAECKRAYPNEVFLRRHMIKYHADLIGHVPQTRPRRPPTKNALLALKYEEEEQCQQDVIKTDFKNEIEREPDFYKKCDVCEVMMNVRALALHRRIWHKCKNETEEAENNSEGEVIMELETQETAMAGDQTETGIDVAATTNEGVQEESSSKCLKCKKSFQSADNLAKHDELHELSPFHCYICLWVFTSDSDLKNHLSLRHRKKIISSRLKMKRIVRKKLLRSVRVVGSLQDESSSQGEEDDTSNSNMNEDGNSGQFDGIDDDDEEWKPEGSKRKRANRTGVQNSKNKVEIRGYQACPFCSEYFYQPAISEDLCDHLEDECSGIKKMEAGLENPPELLCPVCTQFTCSLTEKVKFGEHVAVCERAKKQSDRNQGDVINKAMDLRDRIFMCNLCSKSKYFRLDDFIEHYHYHKVNTFVCTQCSRKYPSARSISSHWNCMHDGLRQETPPEKRYTVETLLPQITWWCTASGCGEKFFNEEERDGHFLIQHSEDLQERLHVCADCKREYASESELRLHKGICHIPEHILEERHLPCSRCELFFRTRKALETHERKIHRINLFVCETCGTECNSVYNLNIHKQLHDSVRKFQCDQCPKSFTMGQYLNHHKLKEHAPHDKKANPLVCKYCDKVLSSTHYLRHHIATVHEKQFRFFCHVCEFGSVHQSTLKKHLYVRHKIGERKIRSCPFQGCGKTFTTANQLNRHSATHEGRRDHACSVCGKRFYDRGHLKRHEDIHRNAETKPHGCHICGKRFPVRNYLYIHMKSHRKK